MSTNSAYEDLRVGKVLALINVNITTTVPDALKCVNLNRSTSITAGVDVDDTAGNLWLPFTVYFHPCIKYGQGCAFCFNLHRDNALNRRSCVWVSISNPPHAASSVTFTDKLMVASPPPSQYGNITYQWHYSKCSWPMIWTKHSTAELHICAACCFFNIKFYATSFSYPTNTIIYERFYHPMIECQ